MSYGRPCASTVGVALGAGASRGVPVAVRSATIRGVRYRVDVDSELHGFATVNGNVEREIVVSAHLPPSKFLNALLHEGLHACFPAAPENEIDRAATDLSRLLWRAGFRRVTASVETPK